MDRLPRGVFFEPKRNRYRVRLYYCQRVIWRSYHACPYDATEELRRAQVHRLEFVRALSTQQKRCPPKRLEDLIK